MDVDQGHGRPTFFTRWDEMAASSVTGTGPGESHGLQKPENHCGCGCGGSKQETPKPPQRRIGCFSRHVVNSGVVRNRSGSAPVQSKSCF